MCERETFKKLNDFMVETTGETGMLGPHWIIRIYSLQHTGSMFVSGRGRSDRNAIEKTKRVKFLPSELFYQTSVFLNLLIT